MPKVEGQFGCARCDVPLEGPAEPAPDDRFICPLCGAGDTLQNVEREILEQFGAKVTDIIKRGVGKARHLSVEGARGPRRDYRFKIVPV